MKKMIVALVIMVTALPFAQAQAISTDFQKGTIVTATNETIEGAIRDLTKNKGTIVFVSSTGAKKTYTPAELLGFTLNGSNYISFADDFYKVIALGKAALYQRVTNNSGKLLYNGGEAISITNKPGRSGDYYVAINGNGELLLITPKNFETIVSSTFADCASISAEVKAKLLDYSQLVKLVEHYNSCK